MPGAHREFSPGHSMGALLHVPPSQVPNISPSPQVFSGWTFLLLSKEGWEHLTQTWPQLSYPNLTLFPSSPCISWHFFVGTKCNPFHLWFWAQASNNVLLDHGLSITSLYFLVFFLFFFYGFFYLALKTPLCSNQDLPSTLFPHHNYHPILFSTAKFLKQELPLTDFIFWSPLSS